MPQAQPAPLPATPAPAGHEAEERELTPLGAIFSRRAASTRVFPTQEAPACGESVLIDVPLTDASELGSHAVSADLRQRVLPFGFGAVEGQKVHSAPWPKEAFDASGPLDDKRGLKCTSSSGSLSSPPSPTGWAGAKEKIAALVESTLCTYLSVFVTIWALLGDDLRAVLVHAPQDEHFLPGTIVCLAFFTVEAVLLSISRPKYFLGFYFWLDVLSTLSLLFDIPVVLALLTPVGAGATSGTGGTLASAGSTANAAAKTGQILRLVRLARVVAATRAFEQRRLARSAAVLASSPSRKAGLLASSTMRCNSEGHRASRLGHKLSDLTTRRVIIGVWCILLATPLFDVKFYPSASASFETGGLQLVNSAWMACMGGNSSSATAVQALPAGAACSANCLQLLDDYRAHTQGMVSLSVMGVDYGGRYNLSGTEGLRRFETLSLRVGASAATFDRTANYRLRSILNLCRIAFLSAMLGAGVMYFSRDADRLVLQPIERMVRKVSEISDNPLGIGVDQRPDGIDGAVSGRMSLRDRLKGKAKAENYETRMLEHSINKICSLMALGFGDAGAEIIAQNMATGGALNPMVPGKKMCAIFGFCDIRSFTDATEVLQEEVMEFVNSIARIVHTEVARRKGSANKNIGDAFLLVWKFPEKVTSKHVDMMAAGQPVPADIAAAIEGVADRALASFVLISAALRHSTSLARFCAHPGIKQRMPGFTVRMGFGLHVGWAIEGAIGSEYKVDASYLSPNVNIASRLEAATKQFGVPLLFSEHFARLLSVPVRRACRQLDRVTLKGSAVPLGLFTFDADPELIPVPTPDAPALKRGSTFSITSLPDDDDAPVGAEELATHPDVLAMRASVGGDFLARFSAGFTAYSDGRWGDAKELLGSALHGRKAPGGGAGTDGPTKALLAAMEAHAFKAPPDWQGYRELTEK